ESNPFPYSLIVEGLFSFFFSLTKNAIKRIEIRQNPGKAKKGKYQRINANKDPRMGLITFPKPLDASTKPSTLLCSASINKSPARAIAIDVVPAAPIPCIIRPINIHRKAPENQAEANP